MRRYHSLGRIAEARHQCEIGLRADPFSLVFRRSLVYFYEHEGRWDDAMDLIRDNIERFDTSEYDGELRLAFSIFRKEGDSVAFLAAIERARPEARANYVGPVWMAVKRNRLPDALLAIEQMDPNEIGVETGYGVFNTSPFAFRIFPKALIKALLLFEIGDSERSLSEARIAKSNLERAVTDNTEVYPDFYAQMAISFAMLSEKSNMESAIEKLRKLNQLDIYRYTNQVRCELGIAIAYLVLGDDDKAIEILEAASKMESPIFLNRELQLWFIFDRLREDPRFDALLND